MPAIADATEDTAVAMDAELSAMDVPETKVAAPEKPKEPAKPAAAKPEPKKEPEVKPPEDKDKPTEKPKETADIKKEPEVKPAESPPKSNFAMLRDRAERFEKETVQLNTKLKELETKLSTAAVPKEFEEQLAAHKADNKQLREKLAELDYTASDDFQSNHYKPYVATWTRAMQSVMGLQYNDENGTPHNMSKEDAEYILSLPEAKALAEAKRLFGDDVGAFTLLTTHQQRIAEARERMQEAKSNAKKISEAKAEKLTLEKAEHGHRIANLWKAKTEEVAESEPWFKEDDADAEGSELLKQGLAEADRAFADGVDQDERMLLHARMRFSHGAHNRLVAANKAKDAKISELETELKAFRQSEPTTEAGGGPRASTPKSIEAELEEMDRANR